MRARSKSHVLVGLQEGTARTEYGGPAGQANPILPDNSANPIYVNVPFPPDAADIMFDEWRPYLGCIAPTGLDATLDFFRKEMEAIGWKPLEAAEAAERWPNAQLSETIENGVRAYYSHDVENGFHRQPPVMLTLQRRDDGQTSVEIRVAPFAMPEKLEAADDMAGLPTPKLTESRASSGDSNSARPQSGCGVVAEIPATLAFYRRELAARNWTEETSGAVVTPDNVTLNFSSAEQTATLELSRKYRSDDGQSRDSNEGNRPRRARQGQEGSRRKFPAMRRQWQRRSSRPDEVRRVAQAAKLSDAPLRAACRQFEARAAAGERRRGGVRRRRGRLDFYSPSTVRAVAAFYRDALKAQGWKETPSTIQPCRAWS